MAFEVFTETGVRSKEFISVTENKGFGLSRAFIDRYKITKEHKAVIIYDPESLQVALHFSLQQPKFGLAVRISNPKHGGIVMARSFFDKKSIDSRLYAGQYDDFKKVSLASLGQSKEGEAFLVQLKEKETKPSTTQTEPSNDFFIDDEPIKLEDIPF